MCCRRELPLQVLTICNQTTKAVKNSNLWSILKGIFAFFLKFSVQLESERPWLQSASQISSEGQKSRHSRFSPCETTSSVGMAQLPSVGFWPFLFYNIHTSAFTLFLQKDRRKGEDIVLFCSVKAHSHCFKCSCSLKSSVLAVNRSSVSLLVVMWT